MAQEVATATLIFLKLFFFYKKLKIKKRRVIWKVLDTIGQIAKILNFGGWIAKIETLVFKLKNIVNFSHIIIMIGL
jgi:adenylate cyclase class IV